LKRSLAQLDSAEQPSLMAAHYDWTKIDGVGFTLWTLTTT